MVSILVGTRSFGALRKIATAILLLAMVGASAFSADNAAQDLVNKGEAAMAAGQYAQSIEYYDQALEIKTLSDPERGNFLASKAAASLELGWQSRQEEPLRNAVTWFNEAIVLQDKDAEPLAWAQSQVKLGDASRSLAFGMYNKGEQEAGAKLYNDAIKAFEAALTALTKDDNSNEWAQAQRALGQVYTNSDTYLALAGKQSNVTRLTRATDAFEAAMEVYSQDKDPVSWAGLQFQLGDIYSSLKQRQGGNVWLEKSVKSYQNVLLVLEEKDNPGVWSQVQYFIGDGLAKLGAANKDIDQLKASIVASRFASGSEYFKQLFPEVIEQNLNNIQVAENLVKKYESQQKN